MLSALGEQFREPFSWRSTMGPSNGSRCPSICLLALGAVAAEMAVAQETDVNQQDHATALEEVVVTASRHSESSQEYAGGLQVFTGADLEQSSKDGFESYLLAVPTVSLRSQNGVSHVAVRGIANVTGGDYGAATTAETVGVYLNDVPLAGTSVFPDLGLYDVQRVEVLKGPQGTLYGEGAMGGAIRIILNEPSTSGVLGTADMTGSSTEHGAANHRIRGALNVPLGERVAMRLVGSYRKDEGFIENLATGEKNANDYESHSARALLKADLTDRFSVDLLAMQEVNRQGQPNEVDDLVALSTHTPEPRFGDSDTKIAALTLNYDFGFAELTSVSSYFSSVRNRLNRLQLGSVLAGIYGVPVSQDNFQFKADMSATTQELRLVSKEGGRLDWVVGAFYRKKKHVATGGTDLAPADMLALNEVLSAAGSPLFATTHVWDTTEVSDRFEQTALYADFAYRVRDNLDVLAGLRGYRERLDDYQYQHGVGVFDFLQSGPVVVNPTDSGIVPKVGLRYRPTGKAMLYGTVSQGFRSSAANIGFANSGVGDPGASSDKTTNYELGAKTQWLDDRVNLNASLFYIRWTNMQLNQIGIATKPPSVGELAGFLGNGGDADIHGAEIQLTAAPGGGLLVGGAVGYTRSKLTKAPATTFVDAELPATAQWTASAFGEYRAPLTANAAGFVRIDGQYVDSQLLVLPSTAVPDGAPLDSYFMSNFRLGFDLANWGVEGFVENLTDERAQLGRGLIGGGGSPQDLNRYNISRPRTFGVTMRIRF